MLNRKSIRHKSGYSRNPGWAVTPRLKGMIRKIARYRHVSQSALVEIMLRVKLGLMCDYSQKEIMTWIENAGIDRSAPDTGPVRSAGWSVTEELETVIRGIAAREEWSVCFTVEAILADILQLDGREVEVLPWEVAA